MPREGPLIGRESELVALERAVRGSRLVTLTGVGGCGKTRVARELAARLPRGSEPLDVVVVEMAGVHAAEHVVDAVVRAVGARERAGRAPRDVLLDRLLARQSVLVIDNCEHVLGEVRRLAAWLVDSAPELRVLATSREPLGLPGEMVLTLSPLSLPTAGGAEVAAVVRSDAGRLFVDRASVTDPGFALTPSTARAVVRICHALDGLPLSLGLAAAQVENFTPEAIADGLSRRGRLEGASEQSELARHRSIRASLDWSYELLDDTERAVFRRLAVFSGRWDTAAARAVALPEASETELSALLGGLVGKGLVLASGTGDQRRWSLLQTVAEYAAEQLALNVEEEQTVRDRQLGWFRAFAADSDGALLEAGGHEQIDDATPNLRLALDRALERDAAVAFEMVGSLLRHWILAEHFDEGRTATARVLAADAQVEDPDARALVYLGAGLIGAVTEDYQTAGENLQRGIALMSDTADPDTRARCLQMSAMLLILTGADLPQGVRNANLAADLMRSSGDLLGHAWALVNVAMAEGICDRFDAARNAYDEFLAVASAAQHPRLRTWAELAAAWTDLIVGSPARALRHAEVALELEGDWPSMTHFILSGFRVHALALAGQTDAAITDGQRLLARAVESGAAMAAPGIQMTLSIAELMAGELYRAEARARSLLEMPQIHTVALMRETLAQIALARGDADEAAMHAQELAVIAEHSGSLRHRAVSDFVYGCAAVQKGDVERGRDLVQAALAAYAALGIERGAADCLDELALIAASSGDSQRSARLAAAAGQARARLNCAPLPTRRHRLAAARDRFIRGDGGAAWDAAFKEGETMALTDAIAYARRSRGPRDRPSNGLSSLTPTELAAARLAATGISNPQIASQLFMARSTVKMHLSNVYLKLGVANRTELARTIAAELDQAEPFGHATGM